MRIANIIEEGRWGGPQKRITLMAAALKAHQVETIVLLPERESNHFRRALDNVGVTWKEIPLHKLGRGWRTLTLYVLTLLFDIYRIWRELRHGSYDLLHVSGGVWQFKGVIAGRLAGVPVIWHLNDTQTPKVFVLLFSVLSPLANAFIVTANRVRSYYLNKRRYGNKFIFSVQPPVEVHRYCRDSVPLNEVINSAHGVKIVTVANVSPVKGLETLISATSQLKKSTQDFHLFVVGSIHKTQKEYYAALHRLSESLDVKQNITFLGGREDIPEILAACDVFVCSSIAEAGPTSVWEAMSMGCAIVSTDVGDVAEYIKDGESGFVVPVGDAKAMADAVYKLAIDKPLRHKFSKKTREVACREFDVSVIAEKTAKGYSAVFVAHQKNGLN